MTRQFRVIDNLGQVPQEDWDHLNQHRNPFLSHAFLHSLETSGSVGSDTGWQPHHLICEEDHRLVAAIPLYLKTHSYGEFVFDWAWAEAYQRAGLDYYPKLVSAVPFTPATGARLLTISTDSSLIDAMQNQLIGLAQENCLSSVHILFPIREEAMAWKERGFLLREDCQFHWHNHSYRDFEDFLSTFTAKRRKEARRERRKAQQAGIIEWLSGHELSPGDWDQLYTFYRQHACMKGGYPYLTRKCFSHWSESCKDLIQVCRARDHQQTIAIALFFQGGDTLYGRYWGANDHYPCLHFELCYYQPIERCILKEWQHFEAGAQGEHKLGKGLTPTCTSSAHWIEHPAFREAIAHAIEREQIGIQHYIHEAMQFTPHHRADHDRYIG